MQRATRELIGAKEARDLLGVSKDTLIRMIARGDLTVAHKNPGPTGAWILWRDEVEKLAAAKAAS